MDEKHSMQQIAPLWMISSGYYSLCIDIQQAFTVFSLSGAHFELFCTGLHLMITFIMDSSADYFLH